MAGKGKLLYTARHCIRMRPIHAIMAPSTKLYHQIILHRAKKSNGVPQGLATSSLRPRLNLDLDPTRYRQIPTRPNLSPCRPRLTPTRSTMYNNCPNSCPNSYYNCLTKLVEKKSSLSLSLSQQHTLSELKKTHCDLLVSHLGTSGILFISLLPSIDILCLFWSCDLRFLVDQLSRSLSLSLFKTNGMGPW